MKILKSMRCPINQSKPLRFHLTDFSIAVITLFLICLPASTATAQTDNSPPIKTGKSAAKPTGNKPKEPSEKKVEAARPTSVTAESGSPKTGKITIDEDKFTGKRTVTLTAHPLTVSLTVSLTSAIPLNDTRTPVEKYLSYATVNFVSTSGKIEYGSKAEVNFLVDGQRVAGNAAHSDLFGNSGSRRVETVLTTLGFDILQKVVEGRKVQMKLGENVFELNADFGKLLKEFLKAAQ